MQSTPITLPVLPLGWSARPVPWVETCAACGHSMAQGEPAHYYRNRQTTRAYCATCYPLRRRTLRGPR